MTERKFWWPMEEPPLPNLAADLERENFSFEDWLNDHGDAESLIYRDEGE